MATDKAIIAKIKENGRHFDSYTYKHSYPHCWRCDTPLLNYATSSWFVAVEKIKDKLLANKEKTEWVPSHLRDGRFGKWLEGARDWAISRNRYWGTPLPIWRSEDGDDVEVISSRSDLMAHSKMRFTRLSVMRHAESEGNLIPIYQGVAPGTDLTSQGKKEAKAAAKWLKDKNLDVIYTSPLARSQQTAAIIAKATGAQVIVDERLREVHFGDYEGKTIDFSDLAFIKQRRQHKIEENKPESIYHFPGMETWDEVQERTNSFYEDVLPKHRSEHVLVVTHADLLKSTKHYFTGEDPIKLSHQPYAKRAELQTYYWDHKTEKQMDLHKHLVDDITWSGPASDTSVEVTLVRHGETEMNAQNIENGWQNDKLTETGRNQAKQAATLLKDREFDAVICSDLPRARETAEIIVKELGTHITEEWKDLRERSTGSWEGKDQTKLLEEFPSAAPDVLSTSLHYLTPDKGESLDAFFARAKQAIELLLKKYAGKKVLIVTHGGTIRAIRALVENLSYLEVARMYPKNSEAFDLSLNPQMRRIPEVVDCWFESGSMPYAQPHFPFKQGHGKLPPDFPADFIAEGVDQTRAWFYTLMVLSVALFNETPYKHVVVNGIVLAEDGKKMSKRLKNYPDPMEIVEVYGADAIRFTLMSSPAVRAEDLRFSEKAVAENLRGVILPLWNTYSFFVTYANACGFEPVDDKRGPRNQLDQWVTAEIQDLVNRMTKELDGFDLSATCAELHDTIDALTNWYVRLSRRRFAGKDEGASSREDQQEALQTLYDGLLTFSQLLAPFCPFIADAIYLNLVPEEHHSVHMTDWPLTRELSNSEKNLIDRTRVMRQIVSLSNKIRGEHTIKARQPLKEAVVAMPSHIELTDADRHLLTQEMNVKTLQLAEDPESLATPIVQVDARKVGPRLGGRVQEIINAGKEGNFEVRDDGSIWILDERLTSDEASIVYQGKEGQNIAADRGIVVSLDTEVDASLEREGMARDLIRTVQRLRKESGLEFTDTVALTIEGADDVLQDFAELIAKETRATLHENKGEKHEVELDDKKVVIQFEKQ